MEQKIESRNETFYRSIRGQSEQASSKLMRRSHHRFKAGQFEVKNFLYINGDLMKDGPRCLRKFIAGARQYLIKGS